MKRLPSSAPDRVRRAKRTLVYDLWRQRGVTWQAIRDLRVRWHIEARAELPPLPVGVYLPESTGEPSEDEWLRDLERLYDAIVPDDARAVSTFHSGWDMFLSMLVLYDPPEESPKAGLSAFADYVQWSDLNIIPPLDYAVDTLPIVWIDGEPYIEVKRGTSQRDVLSAFAVLRDRLAALGEPPIARRRGRDVLLAVDLARLYDEQNGVSIEDGREQRYTYEGLARMFGLSGKDAVKDHIALGRELRRKKFSGI